MVGVDRLLWTARWAANCKWAHQRGVTKKFYLRDDDMERTVTMALVMVALSGCYHATIETGLPPSNETVEEAWAASWIGGLVPPSTVETAAECPDGAARVETKLSFLNGFVAVLTGGIFTPMHVTVTCADGGRMNRVDAAEIQVDPGATVEKRQQALNDAAQLSAEIGAAVFVSF